MDDRDWALRLFRKSVLKQRKFQQITEALGETDHLQCLDIGSDNGVISYLLRSRGGAWRSADLDDQALRSICELVEDNVYQIDGRRTPFHDNEFDRVVIVDFLEHVHTDREFIEELYRIIKPGGELIINVPHVKNSLLRRFRLAIGQTDARHGHVRPGYTIEGLTALTRGKFTIVSHQTYSKFFSECIDTLITCGFGLLKKGAATSRKGLIVSSHDLHRHRHMFRIYSTIYPVVWFFGKLDRLLRWNSGYMLIAKASIDKGRRGVSGLQTQWPTVGKRR
jgi:SAM-dependent methyltransferase